MKWANGKWLLIPLLVLLLVLFGALFNDSWLLYRAAYFLALGGLFGFLWSRVNDPSSLKVHFETSATEVQAGDTVNITLSVENISTWPRLWLKACLPVSIPGVSFQQVVSLRGYDDKSWSFPTPPLKRGFYTLGPPSITSVEVLHGRANVTNETGEILVYPRTEELPLFDPFLSRTPGAPLSRNAWSFSSYQVGGIRNYVYGDSLRRVHWPSSAKAGKLMVKVLDTASSYQVWLLLDMQKEFHSADGESEECLVTAAASVAKKLLAAGFTVGLLGYGVERLVVTPGRGSEQLWNILRVLAVVKAEGRTPLTYVIRKEKPLLTQGFSVIIFTPGAGPALLPSLEELRSSGSDLKAVLWESANPEMSGTTVDLAARLRQFGIATYQLKTGEPLSRALSDNHTEISVPARVGSGNPEN